MNLLKTGLEFLADKLKTHASETVTYRRGANSVSIQATFGKTTYQIESESGFHIGGEIIDFLFLTADLVIGNAVTTPQAGDRIYTDRAIYEVQFIGDGCWRYSDPFGKMIRLHTKEIFDVSNN